MTRSASSCEATLPRSKTVESVVMTCTARASRESVLSPLEFHLDRLRDVQVSRVARGNVVVGVEKGGPQRDGKTYPR